MTDVIRGSAALRDQTVVVTGGAIRVGAAISRAVAGAGARLAIHCHSHRDEADRLASELARVAEATTVVQADLSERGAARTVFDAVEAELGPVTVLVNNAAILSQTPLADFDTEQAERLIAVNLMAPLRLMAEMAGRPAYDERPRVIVNIVDSAANRSWVGHGAYIAAKAGLLQVSRVAARELAPGIRVNVVNPGTVVLRNDEKDDVGRLLARIPLDRIGSADDIAQAVVYLIGAPYTTGTVLDVDGGASLIG